jgi:hypothetical protein
MTSHKWSAGDCSHSYELIQNVFVICYICGFRSADNQTMHGDSYLRQCESVGFAQNTMKLKFENRGTNNVDFKQILCDYDGSYGTYTIEWGVYVRFANFKVKLTECYFLELTVRGGMEIKSGPSKRHSQTLICWIVVSKFWQFYYPIAKISFQDCARDSKIFINHDLVLTLACGAYGNYVPRQEQNRRYFCVDHDGFAVSPLFDNRDIKCSDYIYYEKLVEMVNQANYN